MQDSAIGREMISLQRRRGERRAELSNEVVEMNGICFAYRPRIAEDNAEGRLAVDAVRRSSTMSAKPESSFAGAADLIMHAEAATRHLKGLFAACENGEKSMAQISLRRAISELEIARALLRTGLD